MIRKGRIILKTELQQLLLIQLALADVLILLDDAGDLPSEHVVVTIPLHAGAVPLFNRNIDDLVFDGEPAPVEISESPLFPVDLEIYVSVFVQLRAPITENSAVQGRRRVARIGEDTVLIDVELSGASEVPPVLALTPLGPRIDLVVNMSADQVPSADGASIIRAAQLRVHLIPRLPSVCQEVLVQRAKPVLVRTTIAAVIHEHPLTFNERVFVDVLKIAAIDAALELLVAASAIGPTSLDDVLVKSFSVLHRLSCVGGKQRSSQTLCRLHKSYATFQCKLAGTFAPANRHLLVGATSAFHRPP